MSDADTFFSMDEPGADEHPYIRNGRYWLPNDDGQVVGFTRATTIAETLENQYALTNWKLRQAVRGVGLHPSLGARAGAPSVDDPRYKETLWGVVKDALAAAGSDSGADSGTALHKVLERVDRGESLDAIPEYFHPDIIDYRRELEQHNITILPEYIERTVKCKYYDVVGTLDRVVRLEDGTYAILDIKTEIDPKKYPHAKSIQFAIYAAARLAMDSSTNQYETMPQIRTDFALIAHIRPGSGKCEILSIPIDVGLWGLRVSIEARAWQNTKISVTPYVSRGSWKVPETGMSADPRALHNAVYGEADVAPSHGAGIPMVTSVPAEVQAIDPVGQPQQWSGLNSGTIHAAVRPDGVPPGTVPMGPAGTPPVWPTPQTAEAPALPLLVPPERPPAPTTGSGYDPTTKADELVVGPPANPRAANGEGVDYSQWSEEQIAVMIVPKKEIIQEVCRVLGRRIEQELHVPSGVDEASLKKHKRPLAERALALAAQLRGSGTPQPVVTSAPAATNGVVKPTEADLNYLIHQLSIVSDQEAYSRLYHQWVGHFGEGSLNDPRVQVVFNNSMMQLSAQEGTR